MIPLTCSRASGAPGTTPVAFVLCRTSSDAPDPGSSLRLKESAGFCGTWLALKQLPEASGDREGAEAPDPLLVRLLRCPCYEARAEAVRMLKKQVRQQCVAGLGPNHMPCTLSDETSQP